MKLEVGAGGNPKEGYVHCDIRPDLPGVEYTCPAWQIPFPDGHFEEVYSYHMLEHVTEYDGKRSVKEWYRVLQSGGRVEIHVPDLDGHVIQYWKPGNTMVVGHTHISNRRHALHGFHGWQLYPEDVHKWGYNYTTLSEALAEVGFVRIRRLEITDPDVDASLLLDVEAYKP